MDAKQIALIDAVAAGRLERVKKALADGGDLTRPLTRQEYCRWYFDKYPTATYRRQPWAEDMGNDPDRGFHLIFQARSYDVFEFLVNNGADLKAVDAHHGTSILHHIMYWGVWTRKWQAHGPQKPELRPEMIRLLLNSGLEVDLVDPKSGRTALQNACGDKEDGAVLTLLLERGASVRAVDPNGDTALHAAAFFTPNGLWIKCGDQRASRSRTGRAKNWGCLNPGERRRPSRPWSGPEPTPTP